MADPTAEATVLVVTRLRTAEDLTETLTMLRALLRTADGCVDVDLGRNVDEPGLWVLAGRWRDVGSWRRSLSSYDVKVAWASVQAYVIDEAATFELAETGGWNRNIAR